MTMTSPKIKAGGKPSAPAPQASPPKIGERESGLSLDPLSYLLSVVADPAADPRRRDRCAIAAAPYVHPRPQPVGKKQRAAKEARQAGTGTPWGEDLAGHWHDLHDRQ
jgi:hypothetical protein